MVEKMKTDRQKASDGSFAQQFEKAIADSFQQNIEQYLKRSFIQQKTNVIYMLSLLNLVLIC